jgi:hypothetical protein
MEKKENKEESSIPIMILMTIILLGGIMLAGFILFAD